MEIVGCRVKGSEVWGLGCEVYQHEVPCALLNKERRCLQPEPPEPTLFRVSGFGFRVSGFGFRVRVSGFEF